MERNDAKLVAVEDELGAAMKKAGKEICNGITRGGEKSVSRVMLKYEPRCPLIHLLRRFPCIFSIQNYNLQSISVCTSSSPHESFIVWG